MSQPVSARPFRVGMIGCGTVGSGVLEVLHRRREDLEALLGRPIEVVRIAVRDPDRPRHQAYSFVSPDVFSADIGAIVGGDDTDLLVEVAGGVDAPRDWILEALRQGKDVVTANKATLAFHGREIFRVAQEVDRRVFYEASVAAALPIIELIQNGLVGNQVTRLTAIFNGTCNYILTTMESEGLDYATALSNAQEAGFAEADPHLDVSGGDSAHKLALLARLLARAEVPIEDVPTEGIECITPQDLQFARELGYRIKLLGHATLLDQGDWDLRVHPTLIPQTSLLAGVDREFNAAWVRGDASGPLLLYGSGAGAFPTASSVVADIVRAARGDRQLRFAGDAPIRLRPLAELERRNYLRLEVRDSPGVLGRITSLFGMRGISISSIRQPDARAGSVPIVVVTHRVRDDTIASALESLQSVGLTTGPATRLRIEE